MLELKDYIKLNELDRSWNAEFSQDQIDKAVFYDIKKAYNDIDYIVTLYDAEQENIGAVIVDDLDMAYAYIEEIFDLDEIMPA